MSRLHISCGHEVDSHSIVGLSKEGFKAFQEWKKRYGKKRIGLFDNILKHGGGFQEKYLVHDGSVINICTDCLSNWKVYMA